MERYEKVGKILKYIGQVVILGVTTVCLCLAFKNSYYSFIYVDGNSMSSTLKDGEFGMVDKHGFAINSAKRFDIAVTYYPNQYDGLHYDYCYLDAYGHEIPTSCNDTMHKVILSSKATYKVKRIIAFPGESFTLLTDCVKVKTKNSSEWKEYKLPYNHGSSTAKVNTDPITLGENEYWMIGDNWAESTDSAALNQPIYRKNIQGILVGIEGTCKVDSTGKVTEKTYYSKVKYVKR